MSEQSHDTIDRNDPSIDPDGTPGPDAPNESAPIKPQAVDDTKAEPSEKSEGNIYTPDYEPHEKPQIQRSNPQPVTGAKDADIDTDGG